MAHFDFEKPIQDLEDQLKKVKEVADKGKIDVSTSIKELEEKIDVTKKELYKNLNGWQRVQISRHPDRPYTLDYIENCFENFVEMHGDRNVKDDKAMVGGFGSLDGRTVMFIGQQKGINTKITHQNR